MTAYIVDEEDLGFESVMIKPSKVNKLWKMFKVKLGIFNFLQNHFKPRSNYEPERVEYNALNILAEYQTFNIEFCKNELSMNDCQTALVLDIMWQLLEFDPDSKQASKEVNGQEKLPQPSADESAGRQQSISGNPVGE
jgi:hypothetical protein